MRIGELAARSGVSVRSLRYYEEQGLLGSTRSSSGQRLYGEAAVDRVALIQQLYSAGLPSRTIIDLMPCIEAPLSGVTPYMLERLRVELGRVESQVGELLQTRDRLRQVVDSAAATLTDTALVCTGADVRL